ncbi:SnoaL-like protein [Aliiruegeria haliotis]|uniref:SnoaL-like protein n=2 Tax=Aliiruegeria haliotis TaxID=1280846 RepID=A0A2T0S0H9_9RHOB|nr:SnoaL-like protein [Aliiruegeria haliotis]
MDGHVVWTREDTLDLYRETFGAAGKNEIAMSDERVTMLADDLALYVGAGSYDMADPAGASMGNGPMALTLLLKKVAGEWLLMHAHQSFPSGEQAG